MSTNLLLEIYLVVSTLLLLFIAAIWSRANLPNVVIKIAYITTTFVGGTLIMVRNLT